GCSGSQVDRIRRRYLVLSPDTGKVVSCFDSKWKKLDVRRLEKCPESLHRLDFFFFVGTGQDFSECENTGAQRIAALHHPRKYLVHTLRVSWVVLKPIDEEHGVPVDSAH